MEEDLQHNDRLPLRQDTLVQQSLNHEDGLMGNFKAYTGFNKVWVKLLLLLENALKTQFRGPLTSWKFETSPRPPTHSDLIINIHTEQVKKKHKLCMDLSGMHWTPRYRSKLTVTLKSWDSATHGFQTHPLNLTEAEPSFRKVNLPPAKLGMLFLLTSRLESFSHKSTHSHILRTEAYYSKF